MLPPINKIVLCFILWFSCSFSQKINKIDVSGNHEFDTQSIIEWSRLKNGQLYSPGLLDSAKANLSRTYAQKGYFGVDLSNTQINFSSDSLTAQIFLIIEEGQVSYIRSIKIENQDTSEAAGHSSFSYLEGQVFNKDLVEENINSWLSEQENIGYPFAKAVISSIEVNQDDPSNPFVDIFIRLEQGIRSQISKIVINGNTSTKENVIIRELRLNKDQVYSQNQINEFPKRLNRLRFFEPVAQPEFFINNNNEGVLSITVKEKQTNNFDGIIGYMPPLNEQGKGYLTGVVNVSLRNLFGTGRAAAVRWQQYDRHSQELELRYLEPWVFLAPFNISGSFFQRKQDTTYIQRRIEGMVEFLATQDITAGILVNSEKVIPTITEVPRFTVYNSNSFTTGLNLKMDTRDDPYSPTEGYFFLNTYSFSKKRIYGPQEYITPATKTSLNLQRFMIDFNLFYEIFARQIIAAGFHVRELRGPSFEESDLFRLGGTNTLRGYRENQFLGSRMFWGNLEYRFLLTRRTYVFLFSDNGYYQRKEEPDRSIPKTESFLSGYGAGINLETGIGVLAVSYALEAGESFSTGKIHFGIINEF